MAIIIRHQTLHNPPKSRLNLGPTFQFFRRIAYPQSMTTCQQRLDQQTSSKKQQVWVVLKPFQKLSCRISRYTIVPNSGILEKKRNSAGSKHRLASVFHVPLSSLISYRLSAQCLMNVLAERQAPLSKHLVLQFPRT